MHPAIAPPVTTGSGPCWWHCYAGESPASAEQFTRVILGPSALAPDALGLTDPIDWLDLFERQRVIDVLWVQNHLPRPRRLIIERGRKPPGWNRAPRPAGDDPARGRGVQLAYVRSWAGDAASPPDLPVMLADTRHLLNRPLARGKQQVTLHKMRRA